MDRISYDSYKIDIESIDPTKDISMREVYFKQSAVPVYSPAEFVKKLSEEQE